MPNLKNNPILKDYQKYVKELEVERGFEKDNIINKCLLLGEEVGELFKAIRKESGSIKVDKKSNFTNVEEELADILIFIFSIANRFNINLEKAFREKEEINKKRSWEYLQK